MSKLLEAIKEVVHHSFFVSDGVMMIYMDDLGDEITYVLTNEVGTTPPMEARFKSFEEAYELFLNLRMSRI